MRRTTFTFAIALASTSALAPAAAHAQVTTAPATKMPTKLRASAKITDDSARAVALRTVPGGTITEGELEREKGRLVYSYDVRVPGKDGVDEVHVDATTGRMLSRKHETPKHERNEARKEHKSSADSAREAAERARKAGTRKP